MRAASARLRRLLQPPEVDDPELCSAPGYAEELVQRRGVAITKHNYLPKPFTREALIAKIQAVMVENPPGHGISLSL